MQRLLNFHWDAGRQGIEIYTCIKFRLPQCFSLSVTCPLYDVCLRLLFSKK